MTLTLDIENVQLRSASEWIELLESKSGVLAISKRLFGCEESDIEDFKNTAPAARKRIDLYLKGIKGFVETYPTLSNEPLFIVRSPARLNLRGVITHHSFSYASLRNAHR